MTRLIKTKYALSTTVIVKLLVARNHEDVLQ